MNHRGSLIINDPEIVSELYISKNKYFEKSDKTRRHLGPGFLGNSINLMPSNELWSLKRKTISSALYKDKLTRMLKTIICLANEKVREWIKLK